MVASYFHQTAQSYMNIKNLATITGWTGMDPEFLNDQLAAPPVRSFTFGLKLDI